MNNIFFKNKKGFGLVECVVGLLVFSIVSTTAISIFRYANAKNSNLPNEYRSWLTANNVLSCFQCADGETSEKSAEKFENYLGVESIASTEQTATVQYEIAGDDNYYEYSPNERTIPFTYDYVKYFPNEKVLEFISGGANGTTKLTQNNVVLSGDNANSTFPELTNTSYFKQEKACTGDSSYYIKHNLKLMFNMSDSQLSSYSKIVQKGIKEIISGASDNYIDVEATYTYDDDGYKLIWTYYGHGTNKGINKNGELVSFSCSLNNCNYEKGLIQKGQYLQYQKTDGFGGNDVDQYYYFKVMDSKNTSDSSDDTLVEYIKILLDGESTSDGDPAAGDTKSVTISHLGNSISNSAQKNETSLVSSFFIFLRQHSIFKLDKMNYYRTMANSSDWNTTISVKQDSSYEYSAIASSGFTYDIDYVLHNNDEVISVYNSNGDLLYGYTDSVSSAAENFAKFQASPCRFTQSSTKTVDGTSYKKWCRKVTQAKAGSVSFNDTSHTIIFNSVSNEPMFKFEYGSSPDDITKYNNDKNSIVGFGNNSEYKDLYSFNVTYTPKTASFKVKKESKAEFDAIKKVFTDNGKSSYLTKADKTEKVEEFTVNVITKVSTSNKKNYTTTYTAYPYTCTAKLTYAYELVGFEVKRENVAVTYSGGNVSYSTKETYTPIFESSIKGEPTYTVTVGDDKYEKTTKPSNLWLESNITIPKQKNTTKYYKNVTKGSYSSQNEAARQTAKTDVLNKFKTDYSKNKLITDLGGETIGTAYEATLKNTGSRSDIEAELTSNFDIENTAKWTKTAPTSATFASTGIKYRSDKSENPHEWTQVLSEGNVLYFNSSAANLTVEDVFTEEGIGGVERFQGGPEVSTELTAITRYYKYIPSGFATGCLVEATFSDATYQASNSSGVSTEPRIKIWIVSKEELDGIIDKQTLNGFIENHSPDISYRKG